ncbi:THAP domain-containing protein 2-like [Archocentrus centrarchus]|uniref:THAP domain-containing protein 2-like n=1 Tax=Archocentrus centrarchus TaxID=63155 RepID=UPI0011E9FFAC|nr:THAP domain-containing protein 2-like [Archocentrus centrarchus]
MPDFCAAVGCAHQRNASTKQQGITFHRFPKDKVKRQLWKVALRRRDFSPSERSVVCSCHFQAEDFDRTGQTTRIREGAIPSVFGFTRPRGKAACRGRTSRTSQKAAEEPLQVQVHVTPEPTESDHRYALDPANVKKRLNEAQEELEKLRRNLRNAKDRERRHKKTVKSVLEDLKHKHVLSEELQQRLGDILLG